MLTVCSAGAVLGRGVPDDEPARRRAAADSGRLKAKVPRVPLPEVAVTMSGPPSPRAAMRRSFAPEGRFEDVGRAADRESAPDTVSNGAGLSTKIGGVTAS